MNYTINEERLTAEDYIGFLKETDFLLVAEYGENCKNPELVVYMRR